MVVRRRFVQVVVVMLTAALATVGLAVSTTTPAHAWPGAIDWSFDGPQIVQSNDYLQDLVATPDGKLLVLARIQSHVSLSRMDAGGRLDVGFGGGGAGRMVETREGWPISVRVRPDGKVLVLASATTDPYSVVLFRYLPDGTPDASFGVDGRVSVGDTATSPYGFELLPDGSLFISAGTRYPNPQDGIWVRPTLMRLSSNGAVDTSFGDNGQRVLQTPFQGYGFSAVPLADGHVIVGGLEFNSPDRGYLARLTASGDLDPTFAGGGLIATPDAIWGLESAPDGSLLAVMSRTVERTTSVKRFSTSGLGLDTSATFSGKADPNALVVDADGSALVATSNQQAAWLTRLTPDLDPDPSFAIAGRANAPRSSAIALQPSGRVVLAAGTRLVGFRGGKPVGLVLDGWGGLHPFGPGTAKPTMSLQGAPYWSGWDIARGLATVPGPSGIQGGYVLDGWGGIHRFGVNGQAKPPAPNAGTPYWKGWDIARDVAVLPDGSGGYVLDGWGGLHPVGFGGNPAPRSTSFGPYWKGWDIARGVALLDDGTGGYVLDGWGGIHAFAIGTNPKPPPISGPYWHGWDIARGLTLLPFGKGAYVLDGWGGTHRLGVAPEPIGTPYWKGWDIARSISVP